MAEEAISMIFKSLLPDIFMGFIFSANFVLKI